MKGQRGYSLTELVATVVFVVLGGAILIGMAPEPRGPLPQTFNNLRIINQAASAYREDFQGYFPITLSYSRGAMPRQSVHLEGWCVWSFGGKNNSSHWGYQAFDVEAADRPLNPYVIPDEFFETPQIPFVMVPNHPARTRAAAPMFEDPGDHVSIQRNWPNPTSGITGYNDVGSSYAMNMRWWDQVSGPFVERFNEGTRRLAAGEGVDPSRFVWLTDQFGDVLANTTNRRLIIANGYGDKNQAPLLFVDGHVTYTRITPRVPSAPGFTFVFEP